MLDSMCVLLIEDNENECRAIQDYAEMVDGVNIAGVTGDAEEALELVTALIPDVIILDLELHKGGGNGLLFLVGLAQMELSFRPYILITTNNVSDMTFESARQLGADFILAKYETKYSAQYVVEFVRMLKNTMRKRTIPESAHTSTPQERDQRYIQRIQRELNLIGISPKALGMKYLTDAILITIHEPEPNLSHILAQKYRKTDASVERAMQNAINQAWRNTDPEELMQYYTARIRSDRGMPTLMEFVAFYAAKIKSEEQK